MITFNFTDFLLLLLGTGDLTSVLGGIVFSLIGCAISIAFRVARGIKQNRNTPEKFSFKFYWDNNWFSVVVGYAFTLTMLRFSVDITGAETTMWLAWVYGFLNYRLGEFLNTRAELFFDAINRTPEMIGNFFKRIFKK
jgi:hypothetical protein